jgi:hypothetical protein
VRRGNAPEGTYRASDPSIAQLLCLIEGRYKNRACAGGQSRSRDRDGAKAVGVCLQHHVKVAASRQLPLERADIRCNRIQSHLYPSVTPERW